jgi:hypothetical protein
MVFASEHYRNESAEPCLHLKHARQNCADKGHSLHWCVYVMHEFNLCVLIRCQYKNQLFEDVPVRVANNSCFLQQALAVLMSLTLSLEVVLKLFGVESKMTFLLLVPYSSLK